MDKGKELRPTESSTPPPPLPPLPFISPSKSQCCYILCLIACLFPFYAKLNVGKNIFFLSIFIGIFSSHNKKKKNGKSFSCT
ncbi:hypothetical protein LguiB_005425 [Lonicera macranthoides]